MIYLDYQATTMLAPEVADAMTSAMDHFGNPGSPHRVGRIAAADVALARERVMAALGKSDGQLVFTSGATEALNIAIQGAARAAMPGRPRVITVATEHAAVLDTVMNLLHAGFEPVILPVGPDGLVDLEVAEAAIDERAALLAVMQVNNEIGVMQPLDTLFAFARAAGVPILCDAVQGFGRLEPPPADMIAISAHKIHGPKGIGALWLHRDVDIEPIMQGGGQEDGLRPGTLSPLLCTGFGVAAELAMERRARDLDHVCQLWDLAMAHFGDWTVNGSTKARYRGNLNIRKDGVDGARLVSSLRDISISLGSACASGSGRPSHVLRAIGLAEAQARSSLRIGFGRYTHADEIVQAAAAINEAVGARKVSA